MAGATTNLPYRNTEEKLLTTRAFARYAHIDDRLMLSNRRAYGSKKAFGGAFLFLGLPRTIESFREFAHTLPTYLFELMIRLAYLGFCVALECIYQR